VKLKTIFVYSNIIKDIKIKNQNINIDKLSSENINDTLKTIKLIKKIQKIINGQWITISEFKDVKFTDFSGKVMIYFENDNIIFEPIVF